MCVCVCDSRDTCQHKCTCGCLFPASVYVLTCGICVMCVRVCVCVCCRDVLCWRLWHLGRSFVTWRLMWTQSMGCSQYAVNWHCLAVKTQSSRHDLTHAHTHTDADTYTHTRTRRHTRVACGCTFIATDGPAYLTDRLARVQEPHESTCRCLVARIVLTHVACCTLRKSALREPVQGFHATTNVSGSQM